MPSEGDTIVVAPGAQPPPAPNGFHWQVSQVIFSDTGGATTWTLVKDSVDASEWVSGLQQQFQKGFLEFFGSLGLTSSGGGTGRGDTRCISFWATGAVAGAAKWTVDRNCDVIGFMMVPASLFSFAPAAYGVAPAPGVGSAFARADYLLVCSSSGTVGGFGVMKFPLFTDQTIYYGPTNANAGALIVTDRLSG